MGIKILVIEDDKLEREMIADMIAKQGNLPVTAVNGEEGVMKAFSEKPDVIIIDTVLPGIDGFEVCRRIKALAIVPGPKIIITTGKIDEVNFRKAREVKADSYMVKTSDFRELFSAVYNVINESGPEAPAKNKALVIDDSPLAVEMVASMLRDKGFDVVSAANGEEGVMKARAENPGLIILDTQMPGIDGFETCRRIKKIKSSAPPKIIMTTGSVDAVDSQKARRSGADEYTVKTSDLTMLMKIIERCMG
ncbi:MAG: response regulator [Candidatus Omnitrophica bacterium]|nr:response regulator [Candidatus Omnitrophota bacterium]